MQPANANGVICDNSPVEEAQSALTITKLALFDLDHTLIPMDSDHA